MRGAERYEILYDLPKGEYQAAEVGGIRTRTIRAGESLEVECFPIVRIGQAAERERAGRASSPAQERLNHERAKKRVRRLLEANFGPEDFAVHPTINYGFEDWMSGGERWARAEALGLPTDDEGARKLVRSFIAKIRRRVRRAGHDPRELKYLYVIESTKPARDTDPHPAPVRYHYHIVIHAPGLTREDIEGLWDAGYVNCDRLDLHDNGLAALAGYLTKARKFSRRWAHSKNLTEPEVRVSDRKVSRRRAERVAGDVRRLGREIFKALYPGYRLMEEPVIRYSDFVAGAYIYARMRRR